MLTLTTRSATRFLFIGAHSDDIEIGCGGSVVSLLTGRSRVEVLWVVFSAGGLRTREATKSARALLPRGATADVRVLDFRTSYFPSQAIEIKDYFETLKSFAPDMVFTHALGDRHQDHRLLAELTWNTFRNHLVLEYEIPKYEGDLGQPNVFVPLSAAVARRKARHLCRHFQTQGNKHWFSEETFLALARLRGIECAASSGFAEGFHVRKLTLGSGTGE
jgi:LmbE family N-acetylglucosaminyl deacetylase